MIHPADSGGRPLAGTDITIPFTYPGFSLHDELVLLVDAGLTPAQALQTATTNPALVLGLAKQWGRVVAGYSANFVILNQNPLSDISHTKGINAVVLNGELFDRAQLDQMLNDAKAVDPTSVKH
jgi:imidazolonepropionase-like amidohydrolase